MMDELLQPFYQIQKNSRATLGILIFLLLLVAYTFLDMINHWYRDFAAADLQPQTKMSFEARDSSLQMIMDLPSQHLFGQSLTADEFLPITSLQIHLTGIIQDADSNQSQAIIREASNTGKIYSIGDTLTPGIKIYAINEDGIVLEHAGHLEKLPLVRSQLTFQDKPKTLWNNETTT